jgi:hypothetical protein
VYLAFKENILIATLLKRGNNNVDIKFNEHERFWNGKGKGKEKVKWEG